MMSEIEKRLGCLPLVTFRF